MAILTGQNSLILVSSDANGVLGNAPQLTYGLSADGCYVVFDNDANKNWRINSSIEPS